MTGPIIRATVEDWPKWKIGFEKASSHPTTCASKGVRAFTKSDSPKEVMIPGEYEDVEEACQMLQSQEFRVATRRAGETGIPDLTLLDELMAVMASAGTTSEEIKGPLRDARRALRHETCGQGGIIPPTSPIP